MSDILDLFADPPNTFRVQPFWFLNRSLDEAELRRQIAEMDAKGVGGAVLHCRHGLLVDYMSEDWLDMVGVCIDELGKRGMEAWLYDEDDWPSGTVGGKLTRPNPQVRMRYLRAQEFRVNGGVTWQTTLEADDNQLLCVQARALLPGDDERARLTGEARDITDCYADGRVLWNAQPGRWLVMVFWECPVAAKVTWDGAYYLDTMNPDAVAAFEQMAYEPYLRFKEHFGTTVKGIFTDEPGLMIHDGFMGTEAMRTSVEDPARVLPGFILAWTREFLARFEALKGYDLRPKLMALLHDIGPETTQVRCDYYDAVTTWYVEAYHARLAGWAEEHGIEYIGHTLEDPLWGAARSQGNQVRVLEQFHRPGLDYLGHGVGTRENPFRILAAKCGSSVAHVQGKPRVMCEAFGGSGHGHTLADRRLDANFMACLGVNMLIPHAFYFSFEGFRKTDWPPTEFYHAPFWPWYKHFADYLARLSLIQSTGRHVSDAAILQPMKTVQVDMFREGKPVREPDAQKLFNRVSDLMLRLHHDFDYLDESQLERAQVREGRLRFAQSAEDYPLLVLPGCRVISIETARLLRAFFDGGGRIMALGELPSECERHEHEEELRAIIEDMFGPGDAGQERRNESPAGGVALFHPAPDEDLQLWLLQTIPQLVTPDVIIDDAERRPVEDIICCHRADEARHYFLLVNRTKDALEGTVRLGVDGLAQEWRLGNGAVRSLMGRREEDRLCLDVALEAAEARLVVVTPAECLPEGVTAPPELQVVDEIRLQPHWEFSVGAQNVFILDRWEFTAHDKEAGRRERVVVPGQVNTYTVRFQVVNRPSALRLVLDDVRQHIPSHVGFLRRRRNLEVYVNGEKAPPLEPSTWQDPYFIQTDITGLVREGDNVVELAMISLLEPFQHVNEPAYLVGDFAVLNNALVAPPGKVHGPFNEQGYPHFAGIARHAQRVVIPREYASGYRLILDPGEVHDCCRVEVNGQEAAVRLWPPFEVDITASAREGENEIVVEVANSLANLYDKESRTSGLIGPALIRVLG